MKSKLNAWIEPYDSVHDNVCLIDAVCNVLEKDVKDHEIVDTLITFTGKLAKDAEKDLDDLCKVLRHKH